MVVDLATGMGVPPRHADMTGILSLYCSVIVASAGLSILQKLTLLRHTIFPFPRSAPKCLVLHLI